MHVEYVREIATILSRPPCVKVVPGRYILYAIWMIHYQFIFYFIIIIIIIDSSVTTIFIRAFDIKLLSCHQEFHSLVLQCHLYNSSRCLI